MARIAGVNIPSAKRIEVALTYIFGIGRKSAQDICAKSGIDVSRRVNDLSDEEIMKIREVIDGGYLVEGELRREVGTNIKRLMDLGCYRGQFRKRKKKKRILLPVSLTLILLSTIQELQLRTHREIP